MRRRLPPGSPTRWARGVALLAHCGLIVALPLLAGRLGIAAMLPLLLPLRGLWQERPYTYAWTSLLITAYLGGFLMEAYAQSPPLRAAIALAVAGAIEFCALLFYVRFRAVDQRRLMQADAATAARTPASGDAAR